MHILPNSRSPLTLGACLLCGLLIAACGGGGGSSRNNAPAPNPNPPTPSLSITGLNVMEGASGLQSRVNVSVTLSASSTSDVSVDYATADGTASAGSDYRATSGTLTIAAGNTSGTIAVDILGDNDQEPDETFALQLSNPSNATLGTNRADITITDDDSPPPNPGLPNVSIAGASVTEGNSGTQRVDVSVTLSASSTSDVSVDYTTADGTASAGSDYTATSGTLTIAAGNTSGTIGVDVLGDTDQEPDEAFAVQLSNPSNANLVTGRADITITDDDSSTPVGLNSRPSNTSCIAPARTTSPGTIGLVDAFPNLPNLATPMKLIQAPNDSANWYAVLRSGGLDRFANVANVSSRERYLDVGNVATNGEGGFLSAVHHPNWPTTKEIYVSYTSDVGGFHSRLSRLVITDDSTLPATYTEEILLTVDQPQTNHNGGDIAFGPDGNLYYGLGDGGGSNDPLDASQNTTRLLGNILRLTVNGVAFPSPAYTIPAGNPFAGNANCGPGTNASSCPEIFASGFRNPWRMSFDQSTGELYVGDVGQNRREEVDIVTVGNNYGWRCREGFLEHITSGNCSGVFTDPIFDYDRSAGDRSITGGFVYRGNAVTSLRGKYIFGDFTSGRVWSLENQGGTWVREELADNSFGVAGFSQGNDGEVYVLDLAGGRVYRFDGSGGGLQDNVPDDLFATGCMDGSDPTQASSGLIAYEPAARFWSDGTDKQRWYGLPNGTNINPANPDAWNFPSGSVIVKNFTLNNQLIETRLFMRHPDGDWAGYTYEWNDTQTAATRVRGGSTRNVGGQTWIYPSESQCLECHTQVAGRVLGLETAQLNSDFTYPSTGITDNQIEVYNHIDVFTSDLQEPVSQLPRLADPTDPGAALEDRARAYLHTNCAACHQPGGPTGVDIDLRYDTPLASMQACNAVPQAGDLGIGNARLIAAGDAARSIIVARTNRRDGDAMPPLASTVIDAEGVQLLSDWINSLTACP